MDSLEFKIRINSLSEFNEVMTLAESMGYYNELMFENIPKVKSLFLPNDSRHIQWSHRGIEEYNDLPCKEVTIEELKCYIKMRE